MFYFLFLICDSTFNEQTPGTFKLEMGIQKGEKRSNMVILYQWDILISGKNVL